MSSVTGGNHKSPEFHNPDAIGNEGLPASTAPSTGKTSSSSSPGAPAVKWLRATPSGTDSSGREVLKNQRDPTLAPSRPIPLSANPVDEGSHQTSRSPPPAEKALDAAVRSILPSTVGANSSANQTNAAARPPEGVQRPDTNQALQAFNAFVDNKTSRKPGEELTLQQFKDKHPTPKEGDMNYRINSNHSVRSFFVDVMTSKGTKTYEFVYNQKNGEWTGTHPNKGLGSIQHDENFDASLGAMLLKISEDAEGKEVPRPAERAQSTTTSTTTATTRTGSIATGEASADIPILNANDDPPRTGKAYIIRDKTHEQDLFVKKEGHNGVLKFLRSPPSPDSTTETWFYKGTDSNQGPYTLEQIKQVALILDAESTLPKYEKTIQGTNIPSPDKLKSPQTASPSSTTPDLSAATRPSPRRAAARVATSTGFTATEVANADNSIAPRPIGKARITEDETQPLDLVVKREGHSSVLKFLRNPSSPGSTTETWFYKGTYANQGPYTREQINQVASILDAESTLSENEKTIRSTHIPSPDKLKSLQTASPSSNTAAARPTAGVQSSAPSPEKVNPTATEAFKNVTAYFSDKKDINKMPTLDKFKYSNQPVGALNFRDGVRSFFVDVKTPNGAKVYEFTYNQKAGKWALPLGSEIREIKHDDFDAALPALLAQLPELANPKT